MDYETRRDAFKVKIRVFHAAEETPDENFPVVLEIVGSPLHWFKLLKNISQREEFVQNTQTLPDPLARINRELDGHILILSGDQDEKKQLIKDLVELGATEVSIKADIYQNTKDRYNYIASYMRNAPINNAQSKWSPRF